MVEGQHRPLFYIIALVLRSQSLPHSYRLNEIPHGVTLRGNERNESKEKCSDGGGMHEGIMYSRYLYSICIIQDPVPIIMNE